MGAAARCRDQRPGRVAAGIRPANQALVQVGQMRRFTLLPAE